MTLVRIVAPHFVAGIDIEDQRLAPIVSYMRGWSIERIVDHCRSKGWTGQIMQRAGDMAMGTISDCRKCAEGKVIDGWPETMTRMFLCPTCGNKRCPKATDHELGCTNSNEPGQPGSYYA